MKTELINKCIEALDAGIEMNGSPYAANKMAWVRMRLRMEREQNETMDIQK